MGPLPCAVALWGHRPHLTPCDVSYYVTFLVVLERFVWVLLFYLGPKPKSVLVPEVDLCIWPLNLVTLFYVEQALDGRYLEKQDLGSSCV